MSAVRAAAVGVLASLLLACAGHADRFYTLSASPPAAGSPAAGSPAAGSQAFVAHVILNTSVPAVLDRPEMLIHTSDDQVLILEHDRWAAPLSELVAHTLARDLEQRRPGVLVGDRSFDQSGLAATTVKVDVVQLSARRAGRAVLEAHWRITGPDSDQLGGETFTAPLRADEYAAIAQAYSMCLGLLADRIAEKLAVH
jgi:uncharacterized lipoprotein YmbA